MYKIKQKGLVYYQFPHLKKFPGLKHGIFTRIGGNSLSPFNGLNFSYAVGDNKKNVDSNYELVSSLMEGFQIISTHQVHGKNVLIVDENFSNYEDADALATNCHNNMLLIKTADCQPVLLFDPQKNVIANIHCGWRGSILNIVDKTICILAKKYGTKPENILAGVGPSLGPCCAEFINYKKELPEKFWKYKVSENFFDFWAITHDQLTQTGVLSKNIINSGICTRCNTDLFYSYRKEKITGRFASFIGILSKKY